MTEVERALRGQKKSWLEISERTLGVASPFGGNPLKRVILFGVGSSYHVARLAAWVVTRAKEHGWKVPFEVIAVPSLAIGMEVLPASGDGFLGVSHRGQSASTLEALKLAQARGASVGLVRAELSSDEHPSRNFPLLFTTPLEKVEPHTVSVTGAICAITTLLLREEAASLWRQLATQTDPDILSLDSKVKKLPSILIGDWEGEWIAREIALKFMEMARTPVRAYGSEEFFHGPRWGAAPGEVIWRLESPAQDPRLPDLRGAKIEAAQSFTWDVITPLGWVPTLVELQWCALAGALHHGVDPDLRS